MMTDAVTSKDLIEGFQEVGLKPGDVVLAHSAMRTFGPIDGGADAVIDALREVTGPRGTVVVPTFTFAHEAEDDPVIDPSSDRSEMGIITETARKRPDAVRSTAYRHSFAAIGRRASVITNIDPALPVFDFRSSFGVMLSLNTQVLLLGVTYSSSTSHHFAEMVCEVPNRHTIPLTVKVRGDDGAVTEQAMTDYQPKSEGGSYYGSGSPDFNRLGMMMENRGVVDKTFIGNSAIRRFPMRALIDLAQAETETDSGVFRTPEGKPSEITELDFGQCVMSPELTDGAGRLSRVQWCVKDLQQLTLPG